MQIDLCNPLVSLKWQKVDSVLPDGIQHAQAAVLDDKVYIGGGITTNPENETKIFVFNHKTEVEMRTLKTPETTRWSALATFCGKLVLIGGCLPNKKATKQLWVLQDDDDNSPWNQPIDPMNTPCWGASAVNRGEHLIVAGGVEDHPKDPLNFVQVYNVRSGEWTFAKPLPQPAYFLKTTLYKDTWYLGGGRWQDREVFCASLKCLILSASANHSDSVWRKLPTMSARCSSLAVLEDQLLAVGGIVQAGGPTREIRMYDNRSYSWLLVNSFPVPCDSICSVILGSYKKLLFFGGNLEFFDSKFSEDIYEAEIKG